MNVVSRGIRNAFRNSIRTFSIVVILGLSMGLALAMLVAHKAVGQKINSVKSSVGNTVSISPAGARGFEGGGEPLTDDMLAKVTKLEHVTSVNKTLNDRLTTENTNLQSGIDAGSLGRRNAGNSGQGVQFTPPPDPGAQSENSSQRLTRTFTPPVMVLGTSNPSDLASSLSGDSYKITSGKIFDASSTANEAVIGSSLATKNNLKVGSTFTAYSTNVTIIGIYDAGNTFANNQVVMPLAALQKLSSQTGAITSASLQVNSISNVDSVTSAVKSALGTSADVTNGAEQAKSSITPLENIQSISLYSLVGAIIAGAVIILLTMVMIVRERRREIGVIKAIGASNASIMTQFVVEAITLTGLGSIIGIGLGVVAANPITKLLVNNSTDSAAPRGLRTFAGGGPGRALGGFRNNLANIHTTVGWEIILYGLGAAIVIAIIGSTLASFAIAKVRPAEVMRTE